MNTITVINVRNPVVHKSLRFASSQKDKGVKKTGFMDSGSLLEQKINRIEQNGDSETVPHDRLLNLSQNHLFCRSACSFLK